MTLSPTLSVPDADWEEVRLRLAEFWVAREAPHVMVQGQTRSGKSYLTRHGLLPLCRNDRVLIVDVKGDDRTLLGCGKPVRHIPSKLHSLRRLMRDDKPDDNWFRLVTFDDWDAAREQVHDAFERIYREGDWVLVIDELRSITDTQPPGLRLRPDWERFILRGGSRGVATVNLSQEPRWCPGSFYTQGSFYFFSKIEDERAQKRLAEIGSSRALIPYVQGIPRRRWLYMDNMEDERFWRRTQVNG